MISMASHNSLPFQEPDKEALMENIQAITPNHEARMQSIAVR